MKRTVHIIGNGDHAGYFWNEPRHGMKLTCNVPPFTPPQVYATIMVDFKMMKAIHEGSIVVPGEWIVGYRPKLYLEKFTSLHMKVGPQIKEFYTVLPEYVANYTDFNCGHFAAYYAAEKLKAERIHLWGFDSIFDFNLRSYTDLVINSDRGNMNNNRLTTNWRPLWKGMFNDFKNIEWVLHHMHDKIKFTVPDNVKIIVETK